MANRRMFSKIIVDSDSFLDMPASTRLLYYDLGMNADDDGFVQSRSVMRTTGASIDDLKLLIAKNFVIEFEDKIIVIKDWKVNNEIRIDRYKATFYAEHKAKLIENERKQYMLTTKGDVLVLPNDNQKDTQVRLGKVRLGKEDMSANADASFSKFWENYPKKELKKKSEEIWKRKKLGACINEILAFIEKAKATDRWKKGFVKQPTTFLNNEAWNDDIESYNDQKEEGLKVIKF